MSLAIDFAVSSLVVPIVDVSVLTSAPQAALLIQSLSILAACTVDSSLLNDKTSGAIKLLTTPKSFRASLYQTTASMSDAFRTADQSMLRIKLNLDDMPRVMTSMVNAYAKPEDKASIVIMDLRMKNFKNIAALCTQEAERARQKFDDTLALIQELIQVTTATAGDNEEKVQEANKLMKEYDEEKKALEAEKAKLSERIEEQKRRLQEAKTAYDKAAKKMTSGWAILTATFADSFKNLVGMFGIGSAARQPSSESNQNSENGETDSNGEGSTKEQTNNYVNQAANVAQSVANTAVGNLERAAQIAKDMYMYVQEKEQLLYKEDAANRKALGQIAGKMASMNLTLIDLDEIIYYMSRGVKILGQIQEQWGVLQNFFASLESVIIGPLARHLSDFDDLVKLEELRESGILRNELAITGLKAAGVCLSVSRVAGIYNQVSSKYVMKMIDGSVSKLTMTKDEAKAFLPKLQSDMERITNESYGFIDKKLQESEKLAVEQMMTTRDKFEAALGTPKLL